MKEAMGFIASFFVCFVAQGSEKPRFQIQFSCPDLAGGSPATPDMPMPEVLNRFPNERVEAVLPWYSPPVEENEINRLERIQQQIFADSNDISVLDFRNLPMSFFRHGSGLNHYPIFDLPSLIGRPVVGYTDLVRRYLLEEGGPGKNQETLAVREYFSGVVEAVLNAKIKYANPNEPSGNIRVVRIRTISGKIVDIIVHGTSGILPDLHLWMISERLSDETLLLQTMRGSKLEELIGSAFGAPSNAEDYDMAASIVETILSLPPSSGATTALKILLGRQVQNGSSFKHFGLARGKKRYNENALQKFIGPMYTFMLAVDILSEGASEDPNAPSWINSRYRTQRAKTFLKIWNDLREAKGGGERVVAPAKERPSGSLRVSKDVAVPGVIVVVQQEIGWTSAKEGLATLSVMKRGDSDQDFEVSPGGKLELLTKPRKLNGATMVRVRDPQTRLEGEVYWSTLMVSTKLAAPIN